MHDLHKHEPPSIPAGDGFESFEQESFLPSKRRALKDETDWMQCFPDEALQMYPDGTPSGCVVVSHRGAPPAQNPDNAPADARGPATVIPWRTRGSYLGRVSNQVRHHKPAIIAAACAPIAVAFAIFGGPWYRDGAKVVIEPSSIRQAAVAPVFNAGVPPAVPVMATPTPEPRPLPTTTPAAIPTPTPALNLKPTPTPKPSPTPALKTTPTPAPAPPPAASAAPKTPLVSAKGPTLPPEPPPTLDVKTTTGSSVVTPLPISLATPTPTPKATPTPVATPPPARSSSTAAASAPDSAAPVTSTRELETAMIQSVIDRYRRAYSTLDASVISPFWPGVNARTLSRAFDQLQSQTVTFDSCRIDIKGDEATSTCTGKASFTPKVGSKTPRVEARRWTFQFARMPDKWVIVDVDSR